VLLVYQVYEGDGYSTVAAPREEKQRVGWAASDTFSALAWTVVSHTYTAASGSAYLFTINDRPMVEALGLCRKEVL